MSLKKKKKRPSRRDISTSPTAGSQAASGHGIARSARRSLFIGLLLAIVAAAFLGGWFWFGGGNGQANPLRRYRSSLTLQQIPFDGQAAYRVLTDICQMGPRFSGSPGMIQQQQYLQKLFEGFGGQVERQRFAVRHPLDGSPVTMTNLIVRWHPQRSERILLCAHYDTRPFPDRDLDRRKRRSAFIGANDGASGVAVLAELARWMPSLKGNVGVDFVLFDGEELVYDDDRDPYFLGSRYFAQSYVAREQPYRYRAAVLLDMVGDASLRLYQEAFSMSWRDSRPIVQQIWATADRLGVKEFIPRVRHKVRDDHIMLHEIGKIPACDVIDFDYPSPGSRRSYWHTTEDTAEKCSALSLAKVGWVMLEWLRTQM